MRIKHAICYASIGVLLAACYTLQPAGGAVPPVGTEVAFDINDAGRVALGGAMGPEIAQIEGRLVSQDTGTYLLAVTAVHLLRGGEQTWHGENVRIKSEHITSVYERSFSRGRSIALGAIGLGAAAILGTRAIIGSGQSDPTRPPTDSARTSRRGRP